MINMANSHIELVQFWQRYMKVNTVMLYIDLHVATIYYELQHYHFQSIHNGNFTLSAVYVITA